MPDTSRSDLQVESAKSCKAQREDYSIACGLLLSRDCDYGSRCTDPARTAAGFVVKQFYHRKARDCCAGVLRN